MNLTVQMRKRGVFTLPAEIREKYRVQEGDTYRFVDAGGIFILTRMVPLVPDLAEEIERIREEAGVSLEELLQGLREQRAAYQSRDASENEDAE